MMSWKLRSFCSIPAPFARMSDQNTAFTPVLWVSVWESGVEQLKKSFSLLIPLNQVVDWILIEL